MLQDTSCRVCKTPSAVFFKDQRTFYKCPSCSLIFTNEIAIDSEAEEHYKSQWGTYNNEDWNQQAIIICGALETYGVTKEERVLDFGAGSGFMTKALKNLGYDVTSLEPMEHGYLKDQNYFQRFDALIGIEVIEHLPNLYEELMEMDKVLNDKRVLFFSTLLTNSFIDTVGENEEFASWWYKDDPTHVSFFCNKALFKLAEVLDYQINIYQNKAFALYR